MLRMNLPGVDAIHHKVNKFAMGGKINTTGGLKLNDSPAAD